MIQSPFISVIWPKAAFASCQRIHLDLFFCFLEEPKPLFSHALKADTAIARLLYGGHCHYHRPVDMIHINIYVLDEVMSGVCRKGHLKLRAFSIVHSLSYVIRYWSFQNVFMRNDKFAHI